METRSLVAATAFTTKDGSTIRELFGLPTGGTVLQSLAESRLLAGRSTQRHYHAVTEEIYFILEGRADMELDGAHAELGPGEAVAIPPGAWHEIVALGDEELRFLCCCAPPYQHDDTYFE
jgi:mannose-6-phosphate isomerase-like protein (cupin superfamily)